MEQKLTYIRCGDYFIPDIQLSYILLYNQVTFRMNE